MAAEIVEDNDAARLQGRDQALLDPGRDPKGGEANLALLIGPSNTQGATMPSCLRPAMKVSVFQCPCGTLSSSGSPFVHQP